MVLSAIVGIGAVVAVGVSYFRRIRRQHRLMLWSNALKLPATPTPQISQISPREALAPFVLLVTLARAHQSVASGVPASNIRVIFSPDNDRKIHANDARIDECWRAKLATGAKLFDKSKFRLRSIAWSDPHDLSIELGLTSYKDYIGTNRLPAELLSVLEEDGIKDFNDANAHLSCALGCEAVLLTSDR